MRTIQIDLPDSAFSALRRDPQEMSEEVRIAAAIQWYSQGVVSQGKAAELSGLTRAQFLDELHRRRVAACQVTKEELKEEIHGN